MSEVSIAKFKNKKEAGAVTKLIKQRKATSTLIRGNSFEDLLLGGINHRRNERKGKSTYCGF